MEHWFLEMDGGSRLGLRTFLRSSAMAGGAVPVQPPPKPLIPSAAANFSTCHCTYAFKTQLAVLTLKGIGVYLVTR